MTALEKFDRLESLGFWKETQTSQKKEVVVSFGKASLVMSDGKDTPITHWALHALEIIETTDEHTIYSTDKNGFETVEISDPTMNRAIVKIRKILRKPRSGRGRIRMLSTAVIALCFSLLAVFWLPTALADYTTSVVSDAKAREIGAKLMPFITQYTGHPCRSDAATPVIQKMEDRLINHNGGKLFIADLGARYSTRLPGHIILANRALVENYPGPEVLAGFILMEKALQERDPVLHALFMEAGPIATLSFLVTGNFNDDILGDFAKNQMTRALVFPNTNVLLVHFKETKISSAPFAQAIGNLSLADQDPVKGQYQPILSDPQWLELQSICEG